MTESNFFKIGLSVGLGATAYLLVRHFRSAKGACPVRPEEWEETGEISSLHIYPVKSAKHWSVDWAEVTKYGLCRDGFIDRSFMVISQEGQMVSGRQAAMLVTIEVKVESQLLTLESVIDKTSCTVDLDAVVKKNILFQFRMRGEPMEGVECGEEVSNWLSERLYSDGQKVFLVYRSPKISWTRPAMRLKCYDFPSIQEKDTALYTDFSSYHVATESSVDDLNKRLEDEKLDPISMNFFRPCIVVKGTKPFQEDEWDYIKTGNVILRVVKPCQRCVMVTIDPDSGSRRTEVLEVLKRYRLVATPEPLAKAWSKSPILGAHCSMDSPGKIRVGDKVFAHKNKNPYWTIKKED